MAHDPLPGSAAVPPPPPPRPDEHLIGLIEKPRASAATTVCDLRACHLCTPCAHGNGGECRQTVRCPTTGAVSACRGAR